MANRTTLRIAERLNKPEYWFRPTQLVKKVLVGFGYYSGNSLARVRLPWGIQILVNPQETIGKGLLSCGVYELGVSELLWRLTDPGDWCLDVGANIGYMTSVLTSRAGESGRVFSFEPHPKVCSSLRRNVQAWMQTEVSRKCSRVDVIEVALSGSHREMGLIEPECFANNEGTAQLVHLGAGGNNGSSHIVQARCLDSFFTRARLFGVMKMDVEGAELSVLHGAAKLIGEKRIRDIIYEDFQAFPSESAMFLEHEGYTVFRLAKAFFGPVILDPASSIVKDYAVGWEPVNYLATVEPERAKLRLAPRGYQCLSARI